MSKYLIKYQKTKIFSKIKEFFKNIISKEEDRRQVENMNYKEDFSKNILIKENKEAARLRRLKTSYDNREINEEKLSNEDIDKLIEMYDKEIEELKKDTERIKRNIERAIKVKR